MSPWLAEETQHATEIKALLYMHLGLYCVARCVALAWREKSYGRHK